MHVVSCAKVNLFKVFHQHVNCIWCLHVWDTHRLNRRFRSPADHSLLLPPPSYRRLPRTHWPPSAWDVSNTALGVMSVQQLEPVNDSRWTLVPWSGGGGWEESIGSGSTRAAFTSWWALGTRSMASNRGRITQHEMPLCRGEGDRRGWRLIGVKCMAGNPSKALPWRDASLAS